MTGNTSLNKADKAWEKIDSQSKDFSKSRHANLFEDYYIRKTPKKQTNVTVSTLENSIEVISHIVVWGIHSAIYNFVLPLRARYLSSIQYIVIITDEPIKPEIWESISRFPNILLINGSPLSQETLLKANINYADKAVILGHDSTLEKDADQNNDEMLDSETIFIYKAIKKWNRDLQIMTELYYSSNIEFLIEKNYEEFDYRFSTLYAAGEVYISAIIDTLTCQAYYNPHIVTILQQILKCTSSPDNEVMMANPDLCQSNLWQISVPEECIGIKWEELFLYLLEKDLIWLGLYRLKGTTDNDLPYVYTNPNPDTFITHKDKVFILGVDIEQEKVLKIIPDITLKPNKVDVYSNHDLFKPTNQTPFTSMINSPFMNNLHKTDKNTIQKYTSKNLLSGKRPTNSELIEEEKDESFSSSHSVSKESDIDQRKTTTLPTNFTADDPKFKKFESTNYEEDDKILSINPNKVSGSMASILRSLKKSTDLLEKEMNGLQASLENQNDVLKKSVKDLTLEYLTSVKRAKLMASRYE